LKGRGLKRTIEKDSSTVNDVCNNSIKYIQDFQPFKLNMEKPTEDLFNDMKAGLNSLQI
jgi:hypothetical protein